MNKCAGVFALIIFSMAIFLPLTLSSQAANAQTSGYSIQQVNQTVRVLYSGQVVVTEEIQITGQIPGIFEIGIPYKYSSYVLKGLAFDSNNKLLPVTLGVQLRAQSGFYGANVDLASSTSNTFTVIFILSHTVLNPISNGYNLDFPAYPAFVQSVNEFRATLLLPTGASILGIDKPDGIVNSTSYSKQNLEAFTYAPAIATFTATTGYIQKIDFLTLIREVNIDPAGRTTGTDTYEFINDSPTILSSLLVNLPVDASNVVARDQFGRVLSTTTTIVNEEQELVRNVTLFISISSGETGILTLDYSLPNISPVQLGQFTLNLDLYPSFIYFVDSASVAVKLPEGATIISPNLSQLGPTTDLDRNVFEETIVIRKEGASYVESLIPSEDILSITFNYNPLWIAFRPTLWMWAVTIVGVVIVAIWKRPKGKALKIPSTTLEKAGVGVTLSLDHIKNFIESYEERSKITQEVKALSARAKHGRIPRRRYKVQRRSLELRLETLSQSIARLKAIISNAGGDYADIVRQVEKAEVELNEVDLSLETIEAKHEAGEIPLETYRKQLSELERRKERAEAAINGLMLRLRGEIQ